MKIDIHLTRSNKEKLTQLCLAMFPYFNYVRVRKSGVVFKRRWYSLSHMSSHVAKLVLLELPNALNQFYQENDCSPVFKSTTDMNSAINHLIPMLGDEDVINFMYNAYKNIALSQNLMDNYDPEPVIIEEDLTVVKTSKMIEVLFEETLTYFVNKVVIIVEQYKLQSKLGYFKSNFSCNSPPIRGPATLRKVA